jgi:hypothetical protein
VVHISHFVTQYSWILIDRAEFGLLPFTYSKLLFPLLDEPDTYAAPLVISVHGSVK